MHQLSFFDPALRAAHARRTDPETSHAAAALAAPIADRHRRLILGALARRPMSSTEIARFTGLSMVQVARRMHELVEVELAHDTGARRPTESGRASIVWGAA